MPGYRASSGCYRTVTYRHATYRMEEEEDSAQSDASFLRTRVTLRKEASLGLKNCQEVQNCQEREELSLMSELLMSLKTVNVVKSVNPG